MYSATQLKENCPNIRIGMFTNGTLIDEKILGFIKKQDISIVLSLGGDRETHDSTRGGFDDIISWITKFNNKSQVKVVLQAAKVRKLYQNIKCVWDLDFSSGVFVSIIQNYGWYDEIDIAVFEQEYGKAILSMLNGEGVLICALVYSMLLTGVHRKSQDAVYVLMGLPLSGMERYIPAKGLMN